MSKVRAGEKEHVRVVLKELWDARVGCVGKGTWQPAEEPAADARDV